MARFDRPAGRTLRAALSSIVVSSAAPYGYTLAIWSSGALILRARGLPTVAEILLFVAGAIVGFNVLGLIVEETLGQTMSIENRRDRLLAGGLDWLALGVVVGAVSLLSEIPSWVPWLVGPLAATLLYLLIASLQLTALAIHREPGSDGPSEARTSSAGRADSQAQAPGR